LEGSTDSIGDRDKRDASRATAPMKAADDAIIIDNSDISLEEVVDKIVALLPESDA
jgi:cytidylate kinase